MAAVDASIIFLPRFTTLVGSGNYSETFDFPTLPLDVSGHGGAQFQVWRSPMSGGTFKLFFEESLDADKWVLGASIPTGIDLNADETKFFSYGFRLRWFRLRVQLTGAAWPIVTCWAEGLLRGGGGGAWPAPARASGPVTDLAASGAAVTPPAPAGPELADLADLLRGRSDFEMQAFLQAVAKAGSKM